MPKNHKVQYTVRDIPSAADVRLREVAAAENISLNKAAVQALSRGLGLESGGVRYRSLRHLMKDSASVDRKGWGCALKEMDKVDESDWA